MKMYCTSGHSRSGLKPKLMKAIASGPKGEDRVPVVVIGGKYITLMNIGKISFLFQILFMNIIFCRIVSNGSTFHK